MNDQTFMNVRLAQMAETAADLDRGWDCVFREAKCPSSSGFHSYLSLGLRGCSNG